MNKPNVLLIKNDPDITNLCKILAIPVIEQGRLKAIVSFLF
jgi:hypothetical protein